MMRNRKNSAHSVTMDKYEKGDKVMMNFTSGGKTIQGVAEVKNSSNQYVNGMQIDVRVEMQEVREYGYMSIDGHWSCTSDDIEYKLCDRGHDLMYHDEEEEWFCPFCEA